MSREWLLKGATKDQQDITSDWVFTRQQLIDGVKLREVKNVPTYYGLLVEVFRREWELDIGEVDQVFQSTFRPGGVSAWHAHEVTTDRLFVNHGMIKIVLYDARQDSSTYGLTNTFLLGTTRPGLLIVPPKVWHGIKNVSNEPSSILNLVDRAYRYEDPDHWRLPEDSSEIPFDFDGD